jgi:hypothetical protein
MRPVVPLDPAPIDRIGAVGFEDPFRALEDESPAVLDRQAPREGLRQY